MLQPGDTVLGMDLSHGGHLTHGHPLNLSGKLYRFVAYGVRAGDETLDYDKLEALAQRAPSEADRLRRLARTRASSISPASRRSPRRRVRRSWRTSPTSRGWSRRATIRARSRTAISSRRRRTRRCADRAPASSCARPSTPRSSTGSSSRAFRADRSCTSSPPRRSRSARRCSRRSSEYIGQVVANAKRLAAAMADHGYRIVSGGTDNHLFLMDVFSKGLTGKVAEKAPRGRGDHRQQEHDPVRPEPSDGRERHPDRHARRDHARHGRGRDGPRSPR